MPVIIQLTFHRDDEMKESDDEEEEEEEERGKNEKRIFSFDFDMRRKKRREKKVRRCSDNCKEKKRTRANGWLRNCIE